MSDPKMPDAVDETNDESFPASDPPEWSGAHAGPPGPQGVAAAATLRTIASAYPVDETVARVEHAVTAAGMKVFARVDHAAEARGVGLTMRPAVVVLFGNPKGGTPLMVAKPTAAIDLPLKALAWEDDQGQSWLSYNTPALLVFRHGLDPKLAGNLAPAGDLLANAVRK
jgi:uncharacterized protein (DUF302 family)